MATVFDEALKNIFGKTFKPRLQKFSVGGKDVYFKIFKEYSSHTLGLSLKDTKDNDFNNKKDVFITFHEYSLKNDGAFEKQLKWINDNPSIIDGIVQMRNAIIMMYDENTLLNMLLDNQNNELLSYLIELNTSPYDVKYYQSVDIIRFSSSSKDEINIHISLLKNIDITYNVITKKWGFKINPYEKFVQYKSEHNKGYTSKFLHFEAIGEFSFLSLIQTMVQFFEVLKETNKEKNNKCIEIIEKIKSEKDLFLLGSILSIIEKEYWDDRKSDARMFIVFKDLIKTLH